MIRRYDLQFEANTKLSKNFAVKEFACKDGNRYVLIDSDLIEVLQSLRTHTGRPIKIISGYRTEYYNLKINGAKDSYHCKGMAADIAIDGMSPTKVAILAAMLGARGIGVYKKDGFTHIDTREYQTVFREE